METRSEKNAIARQASVQPTDIAAGLGSANRGLLATCIALFEDTSLRHRVGALFDQTKDWAKRKADEWQGVPPPATDELRRVQSVLDKYLTGPRYPAWSKEARLALDALVQTLRATIQTEAEALKARAASLNADTASGCLRWRAEDELACLREAWCRLKVMRAEGAENVEVAFPQLLTWLSRAPIHPVTYQAKLQALMEVFKRRPSLVDRLKW